MQNLTRRIKSQDENNTNLSTLLRFENPLKQSTFNSTIVLGKIFRSIALMMHLVGVTTNCEKIAILYIVHNSLNFSWNFSKV